MEKLRQFVEKTFCRLIAAVKAAIPPQVEIRPPFCVAVGFSDDNARGVQEILSALPSGFPVPLLLVGLGVVDSSWIEELKSRSTIPVRYAVDAEILPELGRSGALLAPSRQSLFLERGRLRLTGHSTETSLDELFESLARELGPRAVGCLLTGEGTEGTRGLRALKNAGALTLVPDQTWARAATSVIPVPQFAPALCRAARIPFIQKA